MDVKRVEIVELWITFTWINHVSYPWKDRKDLAKIWIKWNFGLTVFHFAVTDL